VAQQLAYSRPDGSSSGGGGEAAAVVGGDAVAAPEARVLVVEPLPLVQLSLQPAAGMAEGQQDGPDGLGLLLPAAGGSGGAAAGEPATPRAAAAAAAGPRSLRLLQGQVYSAQLTVTNNSKAPVGWASVSIR
jgi:hypothetical protein